MKDNITIPIERYQELLDAEEKLAQLEDAGVDCWEGYEMAMEGQ